MISLIDKNFKFHAGDIEIACAKYFDYRSKIIVPNVSWGLQLGYEADLIILTKSNNLWEVEIKVSLADIKADLKKPHKHDQSEYINRLYFAIPEALYEKALPFIPERAGILTVQKYENNPHLETILKRPPKIKRGTKVLPSEKINKFLHLGCMRIWKLKEHNYNLQRKYK